MEGEAIVSETKGIVYIKPKIDEDLCILCGTCTEFCPDEYISFSDDGGGIVVDEDNCLGCSMCEAVCPEGAIEMVIVEVSS